MKNKMLSVLVLLTMVVGMFSPAIAVEKAHADELQTVKWVTFKYDDFSDTNLNGMLQINNNASISGNKLRLTPAQSGQTGSVFSKQLIYNSGNNYSFSTYFSFQFTGTGGSAGFAPGADGITFAIQTFSNKAGTVGSGIGIGGVKPSVAIKFDTFQNSDLGDPSDNYIGVAVNGDLNNNDYPIQWYKAIDKAATNMKDGQVHYAWIDYDGNTKTLSIYLNNTVARPATATLTATGVDLASTFQGSDGVYAGFSSATGSAWENHDIGSWYFQNKLDPIDTQNTNYVYKQAPSQVSVSNAVYSLSEPGKTLMTASALDVNGQPVAGVPIEFHPDIGTIEDLDGNPIMPVPASVSTGADGSAKVILDMGSQPNANPGYIHVAAEGGAYKSLQLPPSPTLSKSSATGTSLTLNWSPVSGATTYHVFDNGEPMTSVSSTTYGVTGLQPDASDSYTVTADVNGLQSAPSNAVSAATPVPGLTATPSPGNQPGTTKVNETAGTDNHLVVKVSNDPIEAPNIGSKAPTGEGVIDPYISGDDIGGVDAGTKKYIGVYEVDDSDNIVSFKLITLNGSDIKPVPAPGLDAAPTKGSQPGTTAVDADAGTGNHLAIQVSNSLIATPNVGDAGPIGTGVTNPYMSGSDIGGVDASNYKYIGVYELDSSNNVVSFKLITLADGDLKPFPAAPLDATALPGEQPGTTAVNAEAGTGHHLAVQVSDSEIATPNIGDAGPTEGAGVTNPYTAGRDISGADAATHKYIGVYELDGNEKVVSFKLITLNSSEISPLPAPELDVTPLVGSQPGSVQMSAEAGSGHRLVAKVSNSPTATPNVGDPAPTGQGVTDPYASETDIRGVDLTTNKYVAVYEVDDNNQVVAYKLITLNEYYTDLKLELSSGTLQVGDTQSVDVKAVYLDQSTIDVTDEVSYRTSDPTVATVDANGVITAVAPGTVTITVAYGGKVVTKTIQVQSSEPNITLTLDGPNAVVGDGLSTITLTATVVNKSDGSPVADSPVTFNGTSDGSKTVETDSHGIATVTFTPQAIVGVTPVHHLITASATDSNGLTVEKNIGVDYMPASVHGVLVNQVTGQPIQNAMVTVQADFNGDGVVDFSQEVETGPDGAYQIVVPRGNWNYTLNIETPLTIDGTATTVRKTQTVEVGAIGTGQELPTENKISGQLIVSNASANASQPRPSLDDLFGSGNVKALIENVGGSSYHTEVPLDADGNFDVNQVPQGKYKISYQIQTPDGVQLAGPSLTVEVNQNGEMGVVYSLIDPYGVVTDASTGRPLSGVSMSLYWADTALNKSNGHQPNTLVQLPPLANFEPNQNANSQTTNSAGEYGWMVFPNGDYYIVAKKDGYDTFTTLSARTTVPASAGSDSYIDNGIIHVGQDLVAFSFSLSKPTSSGGGAGTSAPIGLNVGNVTSSGADLSWNAVNGAASYNIYDNGKLIASGVTGTAYSLKGLASGTQHAFTITAVVNGVESPQSQAIALTVVQDGSEGHHEAYILGYPDGTFKPERDITRQEVAALLSRAFHLSAADAAQTGYPDVKQTNWGAQAIADVTKAGYMSGYPDGTFRPNQPITREELAAIAARIKQLQGEGADVFSDVTDGWAKTAIDSAAAENILTGYPDGTFRPKANISRAEVVTIINRLLDRGPLTGIQTPTWSDVPQANWAFGQIEEASRDHDYAMQDGKEVEVKQVP